MISILITLLVACVIAGVVIWIISLIPLPNPWSRIAQAIVGLILLLWLISYFFPHAALK